MLDSVNSNEYSFAQLESNSDTSGVPDRISRYLGRFSVDKNDPTKILTGKEDKKDQEQELIGVKKHNKDKSDKLDKTNKDEDTLEAFKKSEDPETVIKETEDSETLGIAYGSDMTSLTRSFKTLAATVGSNDDKVTKSQLIALLRELSAKHTDSEEYNQEIAFIKNLIAKFDNLSKGKGYITSFNGVNEIQEYDTVTKEQVTPPIDLRI